VAREHLSRAEQRFNYAIAVLAVAAIAALIVISPQVAIAGRSLPVLPVAVLAGAFLFGLGQMAIGISRRRRYLRGLAASGADRPGEAPDPPAEE